MSELNDGAVSVARAPRRKRGGNGKKARQIDPNILAIRETARNQVAEYRRFEVSARITRRIMEHDLKRMTHEDRNRLAFTLETCAKERCAAELERLNGKVEDSGVFRTAELPPNGAALM